jgi:hypothetical protein
MRKEERDRRGQEKQKQREGERDPAFIYSHEYQTNQ